MSAENELQRCKAEADVQKSELARLVAARTESDDSARKEKEVWRTKESELQQQLVTARAQLDEAKREAEVQALRSGSEQREAAAQLRLQVERLEAEAASKAEQLEQAQLSCKNLEAEKAAALQREEGLKQQSAAELRQYQDEIEDARAREGELMAMLNDIQNSIIASGSNSALAMALLGAGGVSGGAGRM